MVGLAWLFLKNANTFVFKFKKKDSNKENIKTSILDTNYHLASIPNKNK